MITGFRLVLTAFVRVLAAGLGATQPQQEGEQAPTENAQRVGVVPGEEHPWRFAETFFRQPELDGQAVADCVIGEVQPASERFYVRLANMADDAAAAAAAAAAALSWDVGRHTGFRPASGESVATVQCGHRKHAYHACSLLMRTLE